TLLRPSPPTRKTSLSPLRPETPSRDPQYPRKTPSRRRSPKVRLWVRAAKRLLPPSARRLGPTQMVLTLLRPSPPTRKTSLSPLRPETPSRDPQYPRNTPSRRWSPKVRLWVRAAKRLLPPSARRLGPTQMVLTLLRPSPPTRKTSLSPLRPETPSRDPQYPRNTPSRRWSPKVRLWVRAAKRLLPPSARRLGPTQMVLTLLRPSPPTRKTSLSPLRPETPSRDPQYPRNTPSRRWSPKVRLWVRAAKRLLPPSARRLGPTQMALTLLRPSPPTRKTSLSPLRPEPPPRGPLYPQDTSSR